MWVLSVILFVITGVALYLAYVTNIKLQKLSTYLSNEITNHHYLRTKIIEVQEIMKRLDSKGAFKSDDEIGTVFKAIDKCVDYILEDPNTSKEDVTPIPKDKREETTL